MTSTQSRWVIVAAPFERCFRDLPPALRRAARHFVGVPKRKGVRWGAHTGRYAFALIGVDVHV
ncbi:MAG TPA: hypothetical protein VNO21_12485 [Polyangiaceae bacterium]|nr:hypothetical protein [Polyangiaceae bacterium]